MGCRELDIRSQFRFIEPSKKSHSRVRNSYCTPKTAYSRFSHTVVSGHRYYDANMGKWLSRDPLNEYGSRNLYEFINNEAIQPKDRDMRLTVGHTHIHFKMKMNFSSKEMLCSVSSTWWIDDKYDFNKDVFNYGAALAKMGGMKLKNGVAYTNIKKFLSFKFADKPIISDTPKPPKWDK